MTTVRLLPVCFRGVTDGERDLRATDQAIALDLRADHDAPFSAPRDWLAELHEETYA